MQSGFSSGRRLLTYAIAGTSSLALASAAALAQSAILNVSYDVSRELYEDINPAFIAGWKAKTGEAVAVNQSDIKSFNVERTLGSWAEVQKKHFADGGLYDQIATRR
jgi:sulfate transport system substrate-binding protein